MNNSNTLKFIKAPRVLAQELDGEAVLLNLENGLYYGLDAVGYRMYQLITQMGSTEEALEVLYDEYEIAPVQLQADLTDLINRLMENNLIMVA